MQTSIQFALWLFVSLGDLGVLAVVRVVVLQSTHIYDIIHLPTGVPSVLVLLYLPCYLTVPNVKDLTRVFPVR